MVAERIKTYELKDKVCSDNLIMPEIIATFSPIKKIRYKDKWVRIANNKIRLDELKIAEMDKPFLRNKLINRAYAEMYLSNPAIFKWAGMAAFASCSAGEKLKLLRWGKISALLTCGATLVAEHLFWKVALGNKCIYEDIFWQHLAYREAGLAELERIYLQGDIHETLIEAWRMLEAGKNQNNQHLIWQANTILLQYEQKEVIQPVLYSGSYNVYIWKLISTVHLFSGALLTSPVPGKGMAFRNCVPLGNLASFEDRWKWCVESILPAWKVYETENPAQAHQLISKFL